MVGECLIAGCTRPGVDRVTVQNDQGEPLFDAYICAECPEELQRGE